MMRDAGKLILSDLTLGVVKSLRGLCFCIRCYFHRAKIMNGKLEFSEGSFSEFVGS